MMRVPLAAAAVGLALAVSTGASGHAAYDRSDPADGSTVDEAPSEVWAEYTEPLTPNSRMAILDHCDRRADDGNVLVVGFRMSIGMEADHPSTYVVHWEATSAQDGHRTVGTFSFTVAGRQRACTDPGRSPSEGGGGGGGEPRAGGGGGNRPSPEPGRGSPSPSPGAPGGNRADGPRPPTAGSRDAAPLDRPPVTGEEPIAPASSAAPALAVTLALGAIPFLLSGLRKRA